MRDMKLTLVQEMMLDPYIRSCVDCVKSIYRDATLEFGGDCKYAAGVFNELRRELPLTHLEYGFAACEVGYNYSDAKVAFNRLISLHPGDVIAYCNNGAVMFFRVNTPTGSVRLDCGKLDRPAKGLWLTHRQEDGPYGVSILEGAYQFWREKQKELVKTNPDYAEVNHLNNKIVAAITHEQNADAREDFWNRIAKDVRGFYESLDSQIVRPLSRLCGAWGYTLDVTVAKK